MNILYLIKRPILAQDIERLGIASLIRKGHTVSAIDLSQVIHPTSWNKDIETDGRPNLDVRRPSSWAAFESETAAFHAADLVMFLIQSYGLSRDTYLPLKMLAQTGTPYLVMAPTVYPVARSIERQLTRLQRWRALRDRLQETDWTTRILNRIGPGALALPHAEFVVYNSTSSEVPNNLVGPNTHAIYSHTHDFEQACIVHNEATEKKNQAVFLDQFLPYHPDWLSEGTVPVDAEAYFGGLRSVFDKVEREFGITTVIAAHPKADYKNTLNSFGNRTIVYNNTPKLVNESSLVIAHYSTAIGLGVCLKKPVLLLFNTNIYFSQRWKKNVFEGFSAALGTPLRNFDEPEATPLDNAFKVNAERYEDYVSKFLCHPRAPSTSMWDTIAHAIDNRPRGEVTPAIGNPLSLPM